MNKSYTHLFPCLFFLIMATMHSNTISGQVTIGSSTVPKEGALLDLKQNGELGPNSNKGILLPRVKLTKANDITSDISGVKVSEADIHIGLMVYNVNEDFCGEYPFAKGVHTWDGSLWRYIGPDIKHEAVKEYFDPRDGERYLYRSFGNEAGVWMLENMRTKRLPGAASDFELHNGAHNERTPRYGYPSDEITGWTTYSPEKARFGLLYNWYAISNNYILPVNEDQGEQANGDTQYAVENIGPNGNVAGKKYLQGICPNGWHVPSDREWNLLEKEIYENAEKYSTYTDTEAQFAPSTWDNTWNYTDSPRGSSVMSGRGHTYAMLNVCSAGGIDNFYGKSFPAEYGGFNAHITGHFFKSEGYEPRMSIFASASANNKGARKAFWVRMIFNPYLINVNEPDLLEDTKVDRYDMNAEAMIAVRCKQNAPGQ